jgi:hypothetical protein
MKDSGCYSNVDKNVDHFLFLLCIIAWLLARTVSQWAITKLFMIALQLFCIK